MVTGYLHTAISTPDLDRAVAFWAHLGFEEVRRWEWPEGTTVIDTFLGLPASSARAALLEGHGVALELFEFAVPQPDDPGPPPVHRLGYTHVCLQVDDVAAERERLARVGMTFWAEPVRDPAGRWMTYGRDPDGNVIELVERPLT